MSHIHTDPGQHDHTISVYIIRTDTPEPRAFMHVHKKLGKLLPVGGHVELDETPWQAVAHELREESGYELASLQVLQPAQRISALTNVTVHPQPVVMNTHSFSSDHFHSDTSYALVTAGEPTLTLDDGESTDIRWLSREEVLALGPDEVFPNTKEIYQFIFDVCLPEWQPIPAYEFHC